MLFGATLLIGLVLAGVILLGLLWALASYNGLVAARAECGEAFVEVLSRLRQRNALLPALLETARGHMRHEREILERVHSSVLEAVATGERLETPGAQLAGAEVQKLQQVEGGVSSALRRLLSVSEAYPELRAHPNMVRITGELGVVQNQISTVREAYNARVEKYNALRGAVPLVWIAGVLGFNEAPRIETDPEPVSLQQQAPLQVSRMGPMKA